MPSIAESYTSARNAQKDKLSLSVCCCLHLGIYRNCGEGKPKEVKTHTKVFIKQQNTTIENANIKNPFQGHVGGSVG